MARNDPASEGTAQAPLDPSYLRKISRGLDGALKEAEELELEAATARLVIFSDHHKGTRDGADDFLRCEPAYAAALGHYFEAGYRLLVLGDVEELWENQATPVLREYDEILRLEAEFHRAGRYERFWGNHDDLWASESTVREHLHSFFPGIRVRQALKLRLKRPGGGSGLVFLVHGHQGTDDSDRFAGVSRVVVREVWRRIQRRAGYTGNTPAKDFNLRARHDRAMFEWARAQPHPLVLIAGHTHRPVFWTSKPSPPAVRDPATIEKDLQEKRTIGASDEVIASLRAELEFARAESRNVQTAFTLSPPCYFNTGCCSFGDGDVTAIELSDGMLRLVRWPDDQRKPVPKELASEPLETVFAAVEAPVEAAEAVEVVV